MNRADQAKRIVKALKSMATDKPGYTLNELRVTLALERAVARIGSQQMLADHIIFKGGFVLLKRIHSTRFTRDVDAIALGISKKTLPNLMNQALSLNLEDGFWFGDAEVEDISKDEPYGGFRFRCAFQIGDPPEEKSKLKNLSRIHIDINFDDQMEPVPKKSKMNSILSFSPPVSWRIYPLEFIFAEKLETFVSRGSENSRAKDIYDLVRIFPSCTDYPALADAVTRVFSHRGTERPKSFEKFSALIDPAMISRAWPSVLITSGEKRDFHEEWKALTLLFQIMDKETSPKD
jgi:predicted nucleotidyltransferase component of viral defense system